ncbi:MAG: hypothetical protein JRI53_08105 [Deltaproteobacteria bacterium]|nr:hypothetical protein [Deltaproteobacteria bacterium]
MYFTFHIDSPALSQVITIFMDEHTPPGRLFPKPTDVLIFFLDFRDLPITAPNTI